ncbi:MAG: NAD-dependent epimerase/dehydratase family protein [Planctomycetota bacterium]|nr:MAG: NAD-dependent epimerase/dehydratase family protein [Planctomycetota bacterium]REK26472.1 MAG: NAD-dependent epimerase/dehydratase family protein [Planctomycetota bacterium]REK38690.1 MAG: NAD-dependent epimerase/dehydratase family protein [Planctomycetota bacterium]
MGACQRSSQSSDGGAGRSTCRPYSPAWIWSAALARSIVENSAYNPHRVRCVRTAVSRFDPVMSRVVVTGATGFIGQHLVEHLLERGDQVTCLVRRSSPWDRRRSPQLRVCHGDLADRDSLRAAVADAEIVYHLAALVRALDYETMLDTNAGGTRNLASVCAEMSRPPTLLLVSSLAAAGPTTNGRAVDEQDPARPVSNYGRSKRAAELAAAAFADRLPVTIVRPPIVFGPGDRDLWQMFRSISRTHVHPVAGYRRSRFSLIDVRDLVAALVVAAERGTRVGPDDDLRDAFASGCYYFAQQERPTYEELGRRVAAAMDCRVLPIVVPAALAWSLASASDLAGRLRGQASLVNFDKLREATAGGWTCSTARAERELGFEPPNGLDQRLRETAQWYRQAGWL